MPLPPLVDPAPSLSEAESARTARHLRLTGFGSLAQRRLANAHVALVGAGGLGSPALLALAAAGVGRITIIDDDDVELSNLHRQVIHRVRDVGQPKIESARRVASDLAPETAIIAVSQRLDRHTATSLLHGADVVIDGSDTFETREAVAAATEELGIPLVWGTVQAFDAQVTVFWSHPPAESEPIVLSDLYPSGSVGELPTCEDTGVLGALCMQVGSLLATQAISLITGVGEPLLGRVLLIDALRTRQREVPLRPSSTDAASTTTQRDTVPAALSGATEPANAAPVVTAEALGASLAAGDSLDVIDVREDHEVTSGVVPGSRHLPLARVLSDPSAAASGPVVVVCQAGGRAQRAAMALRDVGVDASVLAGGMNAWVERGGTVAELGA